MKMKKVFAAIASVAMSASMVSAFATSASAVGTAAIDFEDDDCSFVYMNDFDGGSSATISVEEYNGSKQLKVVPSDCNNGWTKIWFDLDKVMDRTVTTEIYSLDMDVTIAAASGSTIGWTQYAIGSAGGFDSANIQASQAKPAWSQQYIEVSGDALYNPDGVVTAHGTKKFLTPSSRYTAEGTNPFFAVMVNRPAGDGFGDFVIYVDNIVAKSKDGAVLNFGVAAAEETTVAEETTAAAEETTAAAEETTVAAEETTVAVEDASAEEETVAATEAATEAAPVETEAPATTAAPDAAPTAPAATGNVPAAAMAVVMVAAGAAAVIAKRK